MILICVKSTKRILKGVRYEAEAIYNTCGSGSVCIKGMSSFSVKNFTTIDGDPVPSIFFSASVNQVYNDGSDIKIGDKLVCIVDSYKSFDKNIRYEVESINSELYSYRKRVKIKFVGIKQRVYFNQYSFREMTTDELREEKLSDFFTDDERIEKPADKNIMLMKLLSKSIIDSNRHQLSIIEWGIKQLSVKSIKIEDYSELLDMKLSEIINLLEK